MSWVCGWDGEGKEQTQYFVEETFCEGDVKAASPFKGTYRLSGSSINLGILVRAFTNIFLLEKLRN